MKAQQYWQLWKHFRSPLFVMASRMGWPPLRYLTYQISSNGADYTMLGRPTRGDLWVMREVLVEQTYQPVLSLLPRRTVRVVDVGAHIGSFTVWLHQNHGICEAFCLEPDPESFGLCQFNLRVNACPNVHAQELALGGTTRESELWDDAITHARSSLHPRASSVGSRRTVRVVAFLEWLSTVAGQFDVLKLDCEGAEWEMLDAAPEVFSRFDLIVAEVHHDPTGAQRDREFMAAALSRLGFQTVRCDALYVGRRIAAGGETLTPDAGLRGEAASTR